MRSGRSFDPCAPEVLDSQSYPAVKGSDHNNEMAFKGGGNSSSDLSSPNETCYSFVRRAIERMSTPVNQTERDGEHVDSEGGSSSAVETRFPWLSMSKLEKFSMVLFSRILYFGKQIFKVVVTNSILNNFRVVHVREVQDVVEAINLYYQHLLEEKQLDRDLYLRVHCQVQ